MQKRTCAVSFSQSSEKCSHRRLMRGKQKEGYDSNDELQKECGIHSLF